MRLSVTSLWILRFTLAIGFIYHAVWNISPAGHAWWSSPDAPLPEWMRHIIAGAEFAACAAILSGRWMRLACAGLAVIMVGAIVLRYNLGFSFKQAGWEAPWLYLMICLSVICSGQK
jgi:uncharacterized membrane protein YphA (DoxX/SURF4 family)